MKKKKTLELGLVNVFNVKKGLVMKERNYYFIQLNDQFFLSERMEALKEKALDNEDSPIDYQFVYLNLILKSLSNNGFIYSERANKAISSDFIRRLIRFNTNQDKDSDNEIVHRCLESLEELDLVIIDVDCLIIPDLPNLTQTESEKTNEKRKIKRESQERLQKLKEDNPSKEVDLDNLNKLIGTSSIDEALSGLIYSKFIVSKEKPEFESIITNLISDYGLKNFNKANDCFITRLSRTNIQSIKNKNDYYIKSINKIIEDEIFSGDIVFDKIINYLCDHGLIKSKQGINETTQVLKDVANKENVSPEKLFSVIESHLLTFLKHKNDMSIDVFEILLKKTLNGEIKTDKENIEEKMKIASYDYLSDFN